MYPPDTGRPWSITPDSSYPRRPAPGGSPCPSHSAPSLIAFQFSYDLSKFVNMKTPIHTRLIYDAKSHTWNSHMQQICNTWYLHVQKYWHYSDLNALTMCSLWRLLVEMFMYAFVSYYRDVDTSKTKHETNQSLSLTLCLNKTVNFVVRTETVPLYK